MRNSKRLPGICIILALLRHLGGFSQGLMPRSLVSKSRMRLVVRRSLHHLETKAWVEMRPRKSGFISWMIKSRRSTLRGLTRGQSVWDINKRHMLWGLIKLLKVRLLRSRMSLLLTMDSLSSSKMVHRLTRTIISMSKTSNQYKSLLLIKMNKLKNSLIVFKKLKIIAESLYLPIKSLI